MRYTPLAIILVILPVLVLAIGCGNHIVDQDTTDPGNGAIIVTAYMPYVEDVIIPDTIYAGEDFSLTVRLSSALEPRLLNGDMLGRLHIAGPTVNPARPQAILFPMWMEEVLPPGPAPDTIDFEYPQPCRLPAGEWYIGVQTAKTRELGGVCVKHAPLDYLSAWDEHYADPETGRTNFVEFRLYPITVVERPGA
jgi:hypothetical protein